MIKIAVASDNGMAEHFGHCRDSRFLMSKTSKSSRVKPLQSGHRPGFLPNFLADRGVNVIISGGMGPGRSRFLTRNIEVIIGAKGNAEAAEACLQGTLRSSGSVCREHQHP